MAACILTVILCFSPTHLVFTSSTAVLVSLLPFGSLTSQSSECSPGRQHFHRVRQEVDGLGVRSMTLSAAATYALFPLFRRRKKKRAQDDLPKFAITNISSLIALRFSFQ